ncbi:MAG: hypothetical protein B7Y25_05365 [Alphaproteobacteria bacterium 16-39-46]|nr:MAG: hypothetical protein B7Y25_05365 [Alphaproteobacteria bacterium 16-39-46]OZA42699.1 MAG: hypothetical protein B7X84_05265 [Alphaproteobacteria bacterium 17-39-52]HQS84354.1 DUF2948 family protein [Alphaproteobacteria bacterium]HQS94180.1 DUF2948 family protein [Alphaproteobacteria bacterium]
MTFKNSVSPDPSDTSPNKEPLKLRAENPEDLTIISTFLQDALVPFIGMTHDPKTQTFSLLTHRFRWEKNPVLQAGSTLYERINALLNIHHVKNVQKKGLKDPHDPNQTLNLLCVTSEDNTIILTFSNNIQVQLSVEKMLVLLGDQNISWPTHHKPSHS